MSVAPVTSASTPLVGSPLAVEALSHAKATKLRGAALRNAAPADQRAAVGAQFEAILVRQLLGKTLTSMVSGEGGVAGSVYGDMLADTMASQLTSGQGLGLGRLLEKQLAPKDKGPGTKDEGLQISGVASPASAVPGPSSLVLRPFHP